MSKITAEQTRTQKLSSELKKRDEQLTHQSQRITTLQAKMQSEEKARLKTVEERQRSKAVRFLYIYFYFYIYIYIYDKISTCLYSIEACYLFCYFSLFHVLDFVLSVTCRWWNHCLSSTVRTARALRSLLLSPPKSSLAPPMKFSNCS